LKRIKEKLAENKISLNEKARRSEDESDKKRIADRDAIRAKVKQPDEKVYEITLDNVDKPDLQPVKNEPKAAADPDQDNPDDPADDDTISGKKPAVDPQKSETLNILNDLIDLSKPAKTASADKPSPTPASN